MTVGSCDLAVPFLTPASHNRTGTNGPSLNGPSTSWALFAAEGPAKSLECPRFNIVLSRWPEERMVYAQLGIPPVWSPQTPEGRPSAQIPGSLLATVAFLRVNQYWLLFQASISTSRRPSPLGVRDAVWPAYAPVGWLRGPVSAVLFPTSLTSTIRSTTVSLSACRTPASALFSVAVLVRMASSSSSSSQGSDPAALAPLLPLFKATYPVDLPNTFGAYLICTFLACMLFGLTMHQSYRYFRMYPNDIPLLKALVFMVLCLDLLHTVSSIHVVYFYLVTHYFHPQRLLGDASWSMKLLFGEMGCMMFVTHSFYARRMFLLSRKLFPAVLIVFLIFAELALCLAAAIEWFAHSGKALYVETYTWLVWPTLSIAVLVDIVTTSTLTYYLRKSRTGFKRTDSLVDVLMIYTINTGLSTSMLTSVALICAITMRTNTVYSAILIIATRMYANSMLAVLNSRNSILDKGQGNPLGTLTFGMDVMHRSTRQTESKRARQSIQFKHPESPLHARNGSEVNNVLHIQGKTAMLMSPKRDDSGAHTPQTGSSINDRDE